jgi:Xaa-Pro dipeptidase
MVTRRRFLLTAAASTPALALRAQQPPPAATAPAPPPCEEPALSAAILALKDRSTDIVPITTEERESRIDLARDLMKQYAIDAIVVTTGASMQYYTGVRWGQSERLFAYVLPQAAAPFIICPALERDRLAEALLSFPEHESTLTYLWEDNEDPYVIFARVLADINMTTATLGLEEHTQFAFANALMKTCTSAKFVSATPVTAGGRSIKSPAEVALMRLANQITFDVYKAVYLSCGPGDTTAHFSHLVDHAYARSGVTGEISCNTGAASATPHGSSKLQTIREGQMVLIDDGCQVDGYWSDISRSFVYGTPSDMQRSVFETVLNAQSAALAAAHPGVEMRAVDQAARAVIVKAGYGPAYSFFTHRVGHGIGLDMHEWPYLNGANTQKLAPGMTFSNEPGIYLPGKFGLRLEDDMLITDKGAEFFTTQSPSLQDPFAIPAVLPEKKNAATPATTPAATTPAAPKQ